MFRDNGVLLEMLDLKGVIQHCHLNVMALTRLTGWSLQNRFLAAGIADAIRRRKPISILQAQAVH